MLDLQLLPDVHSVEAGTIRHLWIAIHLAFAPDLENSHASLDNIQVDVVLGRGCRLTRLFKSVEARLSPGQSTCTGLQVLLPPSKLFQSRGQANPSALDTAFDELEHLLGLATTHVLTVQVQYEHKPYSVKTTTVTKTLSLPRTNMASEWSVPQVMPTPSDAITNTIVVHEAILTSILAAHSTPGAIEALASLVHEQTLHPSALTRARHLELHLQAQLHAQLSATPTSTSTTFNLARLGGPCSDTSTHLHHHSETLDPTHTLSPQSQPSNPTHQRTASTDSTPTVLRRPAAIPEDTAHRIWQLMRHDSKTAPRAAAGRPCPAVVVGTSGDGLEAAGAIYSAALRNRRSMGVDTLCSLAFAGGESDGDEERNGSRRDGGRRSEGASAPWM